jgi:hypothetical protein
VIINVARSSDEAARQARGEQVTGKALDETEEEALAARLAAERLFEEGARASDLEEKTGAKEETAAGSNA